MADPSIPDWLKSGSGLLEGISKYYVSKEPRFEIYEDQNEPVNKFRWHIMMSSDVIAASSQGYATRSLCLENVKALGRHIIELVEKGKLI